jgi:hypothetical protein
MPVMLLYACHAAYFSNISALKVETTRIMESR